MSRSLFTRSAALGAALLPLACASAQTSASTPPEFGRVRWQRELEPALTASKESGKPVLLLFQEVPG